MTYKSPIFRLFVSSTFSDMKPERELLQGRVFPKLRDYCKSRGTMFQAVDLRWGISEEAGLDQQTMNICQRELKCCQEATDKPNFLILMGDRYGWRPLPPQIDADEFEELEQSFTTKSMKDTKVWERVRTWYRRDHNAVPPQYVLLPREGDFEEFARWDAEEKALRAILLRAILLAGWAQDDPRRAKYEHSATHQEIDAGALALPDTKDRVLACFRTITDLSAVGAAFTDRNTDGSRDEEARRRLDALRTSLEDRIPESHQYPYEAKWRQPEPSQSESLGLSVPSCESVHFDEDAFTDWVEESLREIIDREIAEKQAQAPDPLDQENAEHEAFGRERSHRFVGRREILDDIAAYLQDSAPDRKPFIIHGVSGTGKTALMGKAVLQRIDDLTQRSEETEKSEILLARFIGATPGSSALRSLLTELFKQLHRSLDFETLKSRELGGIDAPDPEAAQKHRAAIEEKFAIPDDLNNLIEHFREFPARVPADRQLLLFIDAVDQIQEDGVPHTLSWLPDQLPGHVRIVVSLLDRPGEPAGRAAETAHRRFPESLHELTPLSVEDAGPLLDGWLEDAHRTLQPAQRDSILHAYTDNGLPLWLKLVSEEAQSWRSWQQTPALPSATPELLDRFFDSLEDPRRHGRELVATALGYLAAARNGLSDEELLEVVALDDDYWQHFTATARAEHQIPGRRLPPVMWARLHGDLQLALTKRSADGMDLNGFYHRQVAETVERRYLAPQREQRHSRLGDYFHAQPRAFDGSPNLRKGSELVTQWIFGQRWDDLIGDEENTGPLSDLLFIQAKCEAGRVHELVMDYSQALAALPEFAEENEWMKQHSEAMIAYNRDLRAYAKVRCDWWFAKERGKSLSEPEYPRLPDILRDEGERETPEESSPRAARLKEFANFVSGHIALLVAHPAETVPLAYNWADDSPLASQSDKDSSQRSAPWLRRTPRPPAQPLRPQCLLTLYGHKGPVDSVSWNPDGRRAISGSRDTTVRIWDTHSGQCLRILEGHMDRVNSVCFSPDALRALSGSSDKTVRLWDLDTGACLRILEGHDKGVTSVSISPDGCRVISSSFDTTIRVWDLETGKCLHTLEDHSFDEKTNDWQLSRGVMSVCWSPDGRRALSGSGYATLRLWDLETGACLHTLERQREVRAVGVSADGKRLVSESGEELWDLATGASLIPNRGHSHSISTVVFGPDARRAVSASADKTLRVWDLETGVCLRTLKGHNGPVNAVSIKPDGRYAVSGGGNLRVWDLETGQCLHIINGHSRSMCVSPDGRRVVSCSGDSVQVWDLDTNASPPKSAPYVVSSARMNSDGQPAVLVGFDKTLRYWNPKTGKSNTLVDGKDVSPDGRRAVLTTGDKGAHLKVLDLETQACLCIFKGHRDRVLSVSVSPNGRHVVSGSYHNTLLLWDLETGSCLHSLEGHKSGVATVSISPDGRRAISAGGRFYTVEQESIMVESLDDLRIWDIATGACLDALEANSLVRSVTWSPDGRRVVLGSDDNTLRIWDTEAQEFLRILEGHESAVVSSGVSLDNRYLVSGSDDKTLRVWDLNSGQCLAIHRAEAAVSTVAFFRASGHAKHSPARISKQSITPILPPTNCTSTSSSSIVCVTSRQSYFLTPVNFPPPGPAILTAFESAPPFADPRLNPELPAAKCPCCGQWFTPSPLVSDALRELTAIDPPTSQTFDDPRLLVTCPHCNATLKFNPFFVHTFH